MSATVVFSPKNSAGLQSALANTAALRLALVKVHLGHGLILNFAKAPEKAILGFDRGHGLGHSFDIKLLWNFWFYDRQL